MVRMMTFLTQNRFHSPERQKDGIQDTNLFTLPKTDNQLKEEHAKSYVRHRVTFTTTKDMDLAKGMQKYHYGEWTKMLKDPTFKFHCTRTPDKWKGELIQKHLNVNLINLMYNRIWLLKMVKQRVIS